MTSQPITANTLWDALRLVACSTGLKAQRIVLVHKGDVEKALALIQKGDQQVVSSSSPSPIVQRALDMVEESSIRMEGYTQAQRAELEREARTIVAASPSQ